MVAPMPHFWLSGNGVGKTVCKNTGHHVSACECSFYTMGALIQISAVLSNVSKNYNIHMWAGAWLETQACQYHLAGAYKKYRRVSEQPTQRQ